MLAWIWPNVLHPRIRKMTHQVTGSMENSWRLLRGKDLILRHASWWDFLYPHQTRNLWASRSLGKEERSQKPALLLTLQPHTSLSCPGLQRRAECFSHERSLLHPPLKWSHVDFSGCQSEDLSQKLGRGAEKWRGKLDRSPFHHRDQVINHYSHLPAHHLWLFQSSACENQGQEMPSLYLSDFTLLLKIHEWIHSCCTKKPQKHTSLWPQAGHSFLCRLTLNCSPVAHWYPILQTVLSCFSVLVYALLST